MKKGPRPAVVDGADLSLGAFLLMPVFAAGLSVTMWLELPTFGEALEARRGLIGERRAVFARLAAEVPAEPVRQSRCVGPLSPVPHFDSDEDAASTNVAQLQERMAAGRRGIRIPFVLSDVRMPSDLARSSARGRARCTSGSPPSKQTDKVPAAPSSSISPSSCASLISGPPSPALSQ